MALLKLINFGGMIPATDPRLLPDTQAQLAENTWVYSGALEGLRRPLAVHTLNNPQAQRAYRIPIGSYDKDHIPDSAWLEFESPDVDVVHSPVVDDQWDRFYWAGAQNHPAAAPPMYNTIERILSGQSPYLLGIPAPAEAPKVSRVAGEYWLLADAGEFKITGGANTKLYWNRSFAQDNDSFTSGGASDKDPSLYGETRPISSIHGNEDNEIDPPPAIHPANHYDVAGQRAEMRYGTVEEGIRVTIADDGTRTIGVPDPINPSTSTDPYEGLGVQEARAYVYTWVSTFGEEGPPSPPTLYRGWSEDEWAIRLTPPTAEDLQGRSLEKVRIYRTVTGSAGTTTYFFVAELEIWETNFVDDIASDVVAANDILQSTLWTGPPAGLEGMVSMPNGMIAGWEGNSVWFCQPYRPHAWPAAYTVGVEFPIVGLGVIGQTLVVCTTGSPYTISGTDPATMAMSRIAASEPCLSRGSILSTPKGVVYASSNGLAMAVPGAVEVITRSLVTKDIWTDTRDFLNTSSLRAALLGDAYYCWGSARGHTFQSDAFDIGGFVYGDYTGAYTGALVDMSHPRAAWTRLSNIFATVNCFTDQWTGEVFVIRNNRIYWLNLSRRRPHERYLWRSKIFEAPSSNNLHAMRVWFDDSRVSAGTFDTGSWEDTAFWDDEDEWNDGDDFDDVSQFGEVRLYADGVLRYRRRLLKSGELFSLPSGFKARFWEVEVEATLKINSIEMADTAKELGDA